MIRLGIIPFRGEYFHLRPDRNHLVKTLIYPVPNPALPFLGVHLTRTVHGVVEAGPNAVVALARRGPSLAARSAAGPAGVTRKRRVFRTKDARIAALARALPLLHQKPQDLSARSDALYGAWLCGQALANAGMAIHHKLCHTLGGSFNLPHAETHTIVLPHALAYNQHAAPAGIALFPDHGLEPAEQDGLFSAGDHVEAKPVHHEAQQIVVADRIGARHRGSCRL